MITDECCFWTISRNFGTSHSVFITAVKSRFRPPLRDFPVAKVRDYFRPHLTISKRLISLGTLEVQSFNVRSLKSRADLDFVRRVADAKANRWFRVVEMQSAKSNVINNSLVGRRIQMRESDHDSTTRVSARSTPTKVSRSMTWLMRLVPLKLHPKFSVTRKWWKKTTGVQKSCSKPSDLDKAKREED